MQLTWKTKVKWWLRNTPVIRFFYQAGMHCLRNKGENLFGYMVGWRKIWKQFDTNTASPEYLADSYETLIQWSAAKSNEQISCMIILVAGHYNSTVERMMIDSLKNQFTVPEFICVVSDNEQTNCAEMIQYAEKNGFNTIEIPRETFTTSVITDMQQQGLEYCVLLDGTVLFPNAITSVLKKLEENATDIVYTDEQRFQEDIRLVSGICYKPCFAPNTLRGYNYIGGFFAFNYQLLQKKSDLSFDNSFDLLLGLSEHAKHIERIPTPLLRAPYMPKNDGDTQVNAVKKQLQRLKKDAIVSKLPQNSLLRRVSYAIETPPKVSIIIQNRNEADTLKQCVDSIVNKTTWSQYEILIIENNSNQADVFAYYKHIQENPRIRVLTWEKEWNYSALNNYGAGEATGDLLLFLNNDTEIITENWLEELIMFGQQKNIGAVGCMLLYPDDTIQHAGAIVGIEKAARHAFVGANQTEIGYEARIATVQDVLAVTAACLLVRKCVFEQVNGFDEKFAVGNNDVDFCLRVYSEGYQNIYTPFCKLIHYESKSRGNPGKDDASLQRAQREDALLRERWEHIILQNGDPYYNPNLSVDNANFNQPDLGQTILK